MGYNNSADDRPRCNAWLKRCRECNYKFGADEPKSEDYPCPECGTLRGRCTRAVKQEGLRCGQNHGGRTPKGPASPNWKTGRYSKYLPTDLGERYAEFRSRSDLVSLRDELAMIDARLSELSEELAGLRDSEGEEAWGRAKRLFGRLKTAIDNKDGATVIAAMEALDSVFEQGRSDARIWDEMLSLMDKRRRMAETESRIATRERLVISVEEFNVLVARTIGIIKRHVANQDAIRAISDEFINAMVGDVGERPQLGGGVEAVVDAAAWPTD